MNATPEDYSYCGNLLAEGDRDRWLAALFIPEHLRPYIHALYAFSFEIARIRDIVSEPQLGEIRMQWWREILEGGRGAEAAQNPVSAALLATVAEFALPRKALIDLIEARRFDLYSDPMPSMNDLEGYCGETCSSLFRLAALVVSGGQDDRSATACGYAGVAYALTGLLRALPRHAARGQCYLPADVLAENGALPEAAAAGVTSPALLAALAELRGKAHEHLQLALGEIEKLPQALRCVFVPLAVVPLYLRAMERADYDPFGPVAGIAQWRRQWAMWRW